MSRLSVGILILAVTLAVNGCVAALDHRQASKSCDKPQKVVDKPLVLT